MEQQQDQFESSLHEYNVYLQSHPAADHLQLLKDKLEGIRDQLEIAELERIYDEEGNLVQEGFKQLQGQAMATQVFMEHMFNTIPTVLQAVMEETESERRQESE